MPMFNRQPELPPARSEPAAVAAPPANRRRNKRAEPMAHFAIVGVDQHTQQVVSTVIEALSEDDAQQIAQRQGIIIDEFKPMHPLAGAAAVKMARSDPGDRFNTYATDDEESEAVGPAGGRPSMAGPDSTSFQTAPRGPLGALSTAVVLAVVGGTLWFTVLKDGEAGRFLTSLMPGPQSVEAAIDVSEPLGVDLGKIQGFDDWQYVNTLDTKDQPLKAGDTLRLEAIIPPTRGGGGHRGSAVIGGRIISPGDSIAGYRLVLVREKHVLLQKGDRLVALRMQAEPTPAENADASRPGRGPQTMGPR